MRYFHTFIVSYDVSTSNSGNDSVIAVFVWISQVQSESDAYDPLPLPSVIVPDIVLRTTIPEQ